MKYPRICNWISFRRVSSDEYLVTDNLMEEEYTMDSDTVEFVRKLDGTHDPYLLDESLSRRDVRNLLALLRNACLIRDSKVVLCDGGMFMLTLWIPRRTRTWRIISTLISRALLVLWLPAMILGFTLFHHNMYDLDLYSSVPGLLAGLLAGMVMHELGHGCTAVSFGIPVFEFGFMINWYCLPGAYAMFDEKKCRRMQKIRILAAGVEMNFLLTGVFLMIAVFDGIRGGFWFDAAMTNLTLGLINLVFSQDLDGFRIFVELLGGDYEFFSDHMKSVVRKKSVRRTLRGKGLPGRAVILLAYLVTVSKIVFIPILIVINILVIFGGIS